MTSSMERPPDTRRDAILEAVGFAAEHVLRARDWRDAADDVLERLGAATRASRVYIFRNGETDDGRLTTTQIHEWCAPGIVSELANPAMQGQLWMEEGLHRWVDVLGVGLPVQGHVREFDPDERAILEAQGIRSILAVPVTVDGKWWGHMGFDDCLSERDWTAGELDALRVAAGILSAAIGRQRAETSLLEQEDLYRTLVEQIPAVVYVNQVSTEWVSLYTSPRVQDLFGVAPQEYHDEHLWMELIHPDDRARVLAEDARTDETLEPFEIEYRMVRRDGRIVWIHDFANVVYDATGKARFWSGVMFDITALKEAEEGLARALGIEQEASARLRAVDDMKNTFLHAVSHDLRTPLASVLGNALTLDRTDIDLDDAEARDLIHRLVLNAQKLERLITDLLDLDRLSRGLLEPNLAEYDLIALTRTVIDGSDLLADREISVEGGPVVAWIDGPKVERIIENLLVNAARHAPSQSRIWVRVSTAGDGDVLIRVEDDGPGIPAELRETIFGAFERGPSSSSHAPGSGVGLSLVARFAELHGGRAWVEGREGGGASFRVFLPGQRGVSLHAPR
ncbi:MAG: hypothetical protein QOI81_1462 [Actinomycetota bacterium]|jgi:PAS domain S-box-containing protein|nr:hypothetical protein [Actinomycetota bacterium]